MADVTRRMPFYDLRDWWVSFERVRTLLGTATEEDARWTFYPVAQQPEGGFPYVKYDVSRVHQTQRPWMHAQNVGIEVYMADIGDSEEFMNILIDLAGYADRSATDLQRWVKQQGRPEDFIYHSVQFTGGGEITPSTEQGGAHSRVLTFRIDYSPLGGRYITA